MKKLFLLDAYALIFRAYYSMGKNFMYNSKKQNVTAIYGFTRTIWQLIQLEKPTHLAVVFDHKSQNVRVQEFEYYKANRDATPEDIILSEPYIREILNAMKIPILEVEGYEADDVIGTIAKKKSKFGYEVFMVTPDKDFAQLVEENIKIYKPARMGSKPEILGVKEIKENWNVDDPLQVIDILALWGDSVDNILGIPGIGEKTSKQLVKEFGSVENLIANANSLKGKQKENVINFSQQGIDSKKLATIILDVDIEVDDNDLELDISIFDKEKLKNIFVDLEFRSLQKDILNEPVITTNKNKTLNIDFGTNENTVVEDDFKIETNFKTFNDLKTKYILVDSEQLLVELIDLLYNTNCFAFDTETTSLNIYELNIVGISFCFKKNEAYYVPLAGTKDYVCDTLKRFYEIFADVKKLKIAQNFKFDQKVLNKYGLNIHFPIFDTMLAHYIIDADSRHNLDSLSKSFLDYSPISYDELVGKGKSKINIDRVDIEKLKDYACEDADITFQLYNIFDKKMSEDDMQRNVFEKIEQPLVKVLSTIEKNGVLIDTDFLNNYSLEMGNEIIDIEKKIYEIAGVKFNLDSPKQLGEVLFDKMQLVDKAKKTKTGQYATGEEILLKLRKNNKIVDYILDYRELSKLKSTYVDALPRLVESSTGRIHTSFNQTIASTGRLSSTEPNLQNIPIKSQRGKNIRKAFIAKEGFQIFSADYSQIELRIIAELSNDETMLDAFHKNLDIHTITASKVFGIDIEKVTKEQRSNAKVVNFGIIYGVSPFGLSQQTSMNLQECKEIINNYLDSYKGIKKYMESNIQYGRDNGFVQTITGRRRYLRDINSRNQQLRSAFERIAINAPVQGSAADLIKIAMINIDKEFDIQKLSSFMTLQVHDELVFEVKNSEIEIVKNIVTEKMENAIPNLKVPIKVECGIGSNWLEAH